MLRLIFIFGIVLVGLFYALRHPFFGLLFYVWNAYFRPEDWSWDTQLIQQLKLSYTAALLALTLTLVRRDAVGGPFPFTLHLGLCFLFLGHSLVSLLLSEFVTLAWPWWLDFAKVMLMTYLVVTLVNDLERLRLFLLVLAYSLGFEGVKQGWVTLLLHPGSVNDNPIQLLGDNNGVAVGMLMLVPIFGTLARDGASTWEKRLHQFFLVGVLYRALSTYSRGGFLACFALGFSYWRRSPKKLQTALSIIVAAGIVLPVLPEAFWERMSTIPPTREEAQAQGPEGGAESANVAADQASAQGRLHFWRVASHMSDASPFFGIGFNSYNWAYDSYDMSHGAWGKRRSVHSSWFGVLGELGYLGFGLYCLILALSLRNCWIAHRVGHWLGGPLHPLAVYAAAIESALLVFVVGGSFLPMQYNEMLWHFVGLSIVLRRIAQMEAESASYEPLGELEEAPQGTAPAPLLEA